jgi:hypothetical protein
VRDEKNTEESRNYEGYPGSFLHGIEKQKDNKRRPPDDGSQKTGADAKGAPTQFALRATISTA